MTAQKYTDRDVRENDDIMEIVRPYLLGYQGSFEFLIDCKMRLTSAGEDSLTVGMVRGILNCMRADPRVPADALPAPLNPHEIDAEVIQMERKPHRRFSPLKTCEITEPHSPHSDKGFYSCGGVHLINRESYKLPATVNSKYTSVLARTGTKIHRIVGAEVLWIPKRHDWGFEGGVIVHGSGVYGSGNLYYDTACIYPSQVRNGLLLTEDDANEFVKDRSRLDRHLEHVPPSQKKPLQFCKHCYPKESE